MLDSPARVSTDRSLFYFTGTAMLAIAVSAIVGWVGHISPLTTWLSNGPPMAKNTAACLLGGGFALICLAKGWNLGARICGWVIVIFAGWALFQAALGVGTGVDDLFWRPALSAAPEIPGDRIPTSTAIALVIIGGAVALMGSRREYRVWLTIAAVGLLTLGVLPLLGYFGSITDGASSYHGMALPSIVSFLLAAAAILHFATRPQDGREDFLPPMAAAAVSLLIAVAIISALTNEDLIESGRRVVRSHTVQASIDQVVARVARMESNARGYAIGGQETMRQGSINHAHELRRNLAVLMNLVADDPERHQQAEELSRRAAEKIAHNAAVLDARQSTGGLAAPAKLILDPSGASANAMISLGNEMKAAESRRLAQNEAEIALLVRNTHITQVFGSAVALILVGLTITQTRRTTAERKRMESARAELLAQLEKIGRQVPGMIFQYRVLPDGTTRFPYVSAGIHALYGLTPDEVRDDGSKILAVIHPDDLAIVRESNRQSAATMAPWYREYRVRHPDGTERWVLGRAVPERESDGSLVWYGFAADITERKTLEESLANARDQALEASRLKSEFLATISHEIRTPMNSVIGMAGLLTETRLTPEQHEMARTIFTGAESLLAIINDILDFSRMEAGRMRIEAAEFDLRQLVAETVALQLHRAREKGVVLTCHFESAPSSLLLGDSGRVRQVLTNLVGNAIKFTDSGQVQVRVRVESESSSRTRVRMSVRDTGIGIPAKAQRLLFQPFIQADGSSTRRFGGTGLGLAICRQLVELMGGAIGFESEPGKGSLFWFELEFLRRGLPTTSTPLAGNAADSTGGTGSGSHVAAPSVNGRRKRLLVAEDNPANQRVAEMMLTKMGYDVTIAPDGQRALAQLAQQPFDGVLMDCQMPTIDGYNAARQIRAGKLPGVNARIPIIALSAYARPEDRTRSLEAGMDDHVSKPILRDDLQSALLRAGLPPVLMTAAADEAINSDIFNVKVFENTRKLPGNSGPSLLPELVRLYLSDETVRLKKIEALATEKNAMGLAEEAHSFGGNAASFGAVQVQQAALELEHIARHDGWPEVAKQIARLRDACATLRSEIARLNLTGS
jgi:PAS domain S-box-containing protein